MPAFSSFRRDTASSSGSPCLVARKEKAARKAGEKRLRRAWWAAKNP